VLGHPDALFRAEAGYQLCRLGWETHTASTGVEARRLARRWRPEAVILSTEFWEESGWLTCAKLCYEQPKQRIILLEPDLTPARRRFARFTGAAQVVSQRRGLAELIDAISGAASGVA
jgi:DNA-binding NarL/FixJ family response regulator